jgi:hypothetical protein
MYRWKIRKIEPVPVVWFYQPGAIKDLPERYLTKNWLYCRHAAAQIGTDSSISILSPDTNAIVAQSPTQPVGYPA